jgi:hypothetical protein
MIDFKVLHFKSPRDCDIFYRIRILVYLAASKAKSISLFLILELDERNPTCKEDRFEYFNSCPYDHLIAIAIINPVFSVTN